MRGLLIDEDGRAYDDDPARLCPGCDSDGYGPECDEHEVADTEEFLITNGELFVGEDDGQPFFTATRADAHRYPHRASAQCEAWFYGDDNGDGFKVVTA